MRNPVRYVTSPSRINASSARDDRDNDVRGVAIEVLASSVIDRCRAGSAWRAASCKSRQRNTGIERSHDERSTKHVEVDVTETGVFADRSHPPVRSTPIETGTVTTHQDWSIASLTDGQVNRPGGSWDERDSQAVEFHLPSEQFDMGTGR